jgi:hypothetical protein
MFVVILVISLLYMPFCRSLSTASSPFIPLVSSGTVATKDESRDFMAVFPDIVRDLTEAGRHLDIPDATKWFAKVSSKMSVCMQYICRLRGQNFILICNI